MDDVLPDLACVLADGVQRPCQPVVVELLRWHAQQVDQHRPGQPIGYFVEGAGGHQPVEDQHHCHGAVVHLGRRGAVTIDDLAYLKHFQQGVQHRQGAQMPPQLRLGQPVYQLSQAQRAQQRQVRQACHPYCTPVSSPPGTIPLPGPLAPAKPRQPGEQRPISRVVSDYPCQHGEVKPHILVQDALSWYNDENQAGYGPDQPDQNLRASGPCGKVHTNRSGLSIVHHTLYFATKGAIPPLLLSIQFLRCKM